MTEPDYVYDENPVNEYYWDFIRESNPEPGDKVMVVTETTRWESKMDVIEDPTSTPSAGTDLYFESASGVEYFICTHTSNHPLEHELPMVRKVKGGDSRGVLERLEVYKDD